MYKLIIFHDIVDAEAMNRHLSMNGYLNGKTCFMKNRLLYVDVDDFPYVNTIIEDNHTLHTISAGMFDKVTACSEDSRKTFDLIDKLDLSAQVIQGALFIDSAKRSELISTLMGMGEGYLINDLPLEIKKKRIHGHLSLNSRPTYIFDFEVPGDATDSEIEQAAKDALFSQADWSYEEQEIKEAENE